MSALYNKNVQFLSVLMLLIAVLSTAEDQSVPSFEVLFTVPSDNASYAYVTCDKEQLRSLLQSSSDSLHAKLDTYNLRLSHIKELLDHRLPNADNDLVDTEATTQKLENVVSSVLLSALPKTCAEAVAHAGLNAESGIYQLYLPGSGLRPFYVYCLRDPLGGAAWTIVQRRQDGKTQFHRNWEEYERGFGNVYSEFFIGLARLHALTQTHLNQLWIELGDFENQTRYARYESFAIGDANDQYALELLGSYEGNAGDSLRKHEGQKFTTKDRDNDMWARNCGIECVGGWWYRSCHDCNLNGQYLGGNYSKDQYGKGIDWVSWRGHLYSMKYVHMAIRPAKV